MTRTLFAHITIPFYFIRHGETEWNRRGVVMGQKDVPLNERGIQQAYEAKESLKNLELGSIYTSSLSRAHQTAVILNESLGLPIHTTSRLWERGWGEGEGQPHAHFLSRLSDSEIPKRAEPWGLFEERMVAALAHATQTARKPPLIVAHGGFFMALTRLTGYFDLRAENCVPYLFRPPEIPTQSWFVCEVGKEV